MWGRNGTRALGGWIGAVAVVGIATAATQDRSPQTPVRTAGDTALMATTTTTMTTTAPTTTTTTTTTTTAPTTTSPPTTAPPTTVPVTAAPVTTAAPTTTAPPPATTAPPAPAGPAFTATASERPGGPRGYDLVGSGCDGQALVHSTLFPSGVSDGAFPVPGQPAGHWAYFLPAPSSGSFDVWATCHALASDGSFDPAVPLFTYDRRTLPGLPVG